MKFNELIKNENVLKALAELKYDTPTEIQEKVIPILLDGNDVLGQSQTGTGKTMAFSLPILENIVSNKKTQVLILAPTRELAIQIERDIEVLSKYMKTNTVCVYGSSSIENQIRDLKRGAEIVVGTPGRVKDLIKRNVLKLSEINYFVLDEADEMLTMGFSEELEFIFECIHNDKQVMLFSATMPKEIMKIAQNYMSVDYVKVVAAKKQETTVNVKQEYYMVNSNQKTESLCRIIDFYCPKRSIIFTKTKRSADEVLTELYKRGYSADVIHGDITQGQRIATLDKFKEGLFNFLIATDVAARGIHVNDVDFVFNYNFPESNEAYVHRIGRTGRASATGCAITLVTSRDKKYLTSLERHIKTTLDEKVLPSKKDIMDRKVKDVQSKIDEYLNIETDKLYFEDYLNNFDEYTLKKLLNQMLLIKLNESIGSDFEVDLSVSKKRNVKVSGDQTRVFLTIGKMDNVEKRDLLNFLEKKSEIKQGHFSNLELMPKFTFVNISNKYVDQVIKKCNNSKLNGRVIRIEKAKKR